MTTAFVSHGKQVMHRGQHFADAADDAAASLIARCLNRALQPTSGTQPASGAGPSPANAKGGSVQPLQASRSARKDS